MTYFPSFFTTEGLKVPADSNPSPRGETMGSGESRVHIPKGGVNGTAETAARAMRINTVTADARAARVAKEDTLTIAGIPFLTIELDTMKFSSRDGNSFAWAASRRSRFTSISSRSLTCPSASNIKYIQIDSPAP